MTESSNLNEENIGKLPEEASEDINEDVTEDAELPEELSEEASEVTDANLEKTEKKAKNSRAVRALRISAALLAVCVAFAARLVLADRVPRDRSAENE